MGLRGKWLGLGETVRSVPGPHTLRASSLSSSLPLCTAVLVLLIFSLHTTAYLTESLDGYSMGSRVLLCYRECDE